MSETHTRGPWTLTHISGSNFAVQEFEIRGVFGDKPNVYPIFNRNSGAIDGGTIYCSPENARLINAAPALLENLRNLVGLAELRGTGLHQYRAALDDARTAIADAEPVAVIAEERTDG